MDMIDAFFGPAISGSAALSFICLSFFTSGMTAAMGLGGGMILMAVMTLSFPIAVLIPVHGAVQLASNAGRAMIQRKHVVMPMLKWYILGSIVGAFIGGQLVIEVPDRWLKLVLAFFMVATVFKLIPYRLISGRSGPFSMGVVASFLSMFIGATGGLVAALFSQLPEKKQVVGTQGAAMTFLHLVKVVVFGLLGFSYWQYLPLIIGMIITGFLGTLVGSKLLDRLPEKSFRFMFKAVLVVLALNLVRFAIWQ